LSCGQRYGPHDEVLKQRAGFFKELTGNLIGTDKTNRGLVEKWKTVSNDQYTAEQKIAWIHSEIKEELSKVDKKTKTEYSKISSLGIKKLKSMALRNFMSQRANGRKNISQELWNLWCGIPQNKTLKMQEIRMKQILKKDVSLKKVLGGKLERVDISPIVSIVQQKRAGFRNCHNPYQKLDILLELIKDLNRTLEQDESFHRGAKFEFYGKAKVLSEFTCTVTEKDRNISDKACGKTSQKTFTVDELVQIENFFGNGTVDIRAGPLIAYGISKEYFKPYRKIDSGVSASVFSAAMVKASRSGLFITPLEYYYIRAIFPDDVCDYMSGDKAILEAYFNQFADLKAIQELAKDNHAARVFSTMFDQSGGQKKFTVGTYGAPKRLPGHRFTVMKINRKGKYQERTLKFKNKESGWSIKYTGKSNKNNIKITKDIKIENTWLSTKDKTALKKQGIPSNGKRRLCISGVTGASKDTYTFVAKRKTIDAFVPILEELICAAKKEAGKTTRRRLSRTERVLQFALRQ